MNLFQDQNATAKCALFFCSEEGVVMTTVVGECKGRIVIKRGLTKCFGWDGIFQPDGSDKTFAELTLEEKNMISHRRKALEHHLEHSHEMET